MRDDEMDGLADDGDDDADEPGFTMVPADDGADDETVDAIVREAATLGTEDRWEEAHEMLLNAVEEQGENATLLCYLGLAAQRLGSDSEAYEVFRRCLALQPTDPFILASAGTGLAAFDDPDAEGTLRLAALTAPDMPYARAAYGSYLAREGMLPEATAELETARTLAPDDAGVRAELAAAYLLAKR
jgi:Flp pilus assembly protein TadD